MNIDYRKVAGRVVRGATFLGMLSVTLFQLFLIWKITRPQQVAVWELSAASTAFPRLSKKRQDIRGTIYGEKEHRETENMLARVPKDRNFARLARRRLREHPDYFSKLLLLGLKRACPNEFYKVPETKRAAILCSALENSGHLNAFFPFSGKGSQPGGEALVELGSIAQKELEKLTDNRERVPNRFDSLIQWKPKPFRRCDYAYWYNAIIEGIDVEWSQCPATRDQQWQKLFSERRTGRSFDETGDPVKVDASRHNDWK